MVSSKFLFLFNSKKGVELSLSTIIVFIIMLIVLILVISYFLSHYSANNDLILNTSKSVLNNLE